jgi:hypothetical protein
MYITVLGSNYLFIALCYLLLGQNYISKMTDARMIVNDQKAELGRNGRDLFYSAVGITLSEFVIAIVPYVEPGPWLSCTGNHTFDNFCYVRELFFLSIALKNITYVCELYGLNAILFEMYCSFPSPSILKLF